MRASSPLQPERQASLRPGRVLLPLGLGTALSLMGDATLYTVLPTHTVEAGIALGSVGIARSINRAIRLLLNGPAGLAYDRWPRRGLFTGSLFLGAFSTALYAITPGFWPLLVGRLLWGLAWSGIWVGGATIILDVTNDQDRGRWTGLYQTWFFLGAALGALASGLLTDWIGYANTLWAGAAITIIGALFTLFFLPETRGSASFQHAAPEVRLKDSPASMRLSSGIWVAVTLQGIVRFVTAGVLAATMALLVEERLPASPLAGGAAYGVATLTGLLSAGRTLISTIAAPLAGTLSDRLGSRWAVTQAGLAAGVVSMILLGMSSPALLMAGILLNAAAAGGLQALATTITGDLAETAQRGQAIGLLHTSGDLGSALGPLVAYALIPGIGLPGVYWVCAALFAFGSLLTAWFRQK